MVDRSTTGHSTFIVVAPFTTPPTPTTQLSNPRVQLASQHEPIVQQSFGGCRVASSYKRSWHTAGTSSRNAGNVLSTHTTTTSCTLLTLNASGNRWCVCGNHATRQYTGFLFEASAMQRLIRDCTFGTTTDGIASMSLWNSSAYHTHRRDHPRKPPFITDK
jgi:hypothetical protein